MHVEICDVSCVLVKSVKTQKQIKYKKKNRTLGQPMGFTGSPDEEKGWWYQILR